MILYQKLTINHLSLVDEREKSFCNGRGKKRVW